MTDDLVKRLMRCDIDSANEGSIKSYEPIFRQAADRIEELQDFCIWLTGCGYDFCQHDYFIKQRDKLLKDYKIGPFNESPDG